MTEWLTLNTADGPMQAYCARPSFPTHRAIIVLQEAFGVNTHIQDVTRRFAEDGFLAIAPELFHRSNVKKFGYDQHSEAVATISAIDDHFITTDIGAVLDHLKDSVGIPPENCAAVGFCFGGRAAFAAATSFPNIGAAVVFYGGGIAAGPHALLNKAPQITAPLMFHVGDQDHLIPAEQIEAIEIALTAAGTRFVQHVYPGVGHAFACDARPNNFRPDAAHDAWARTYAFLDNHLPPAA